MTDETDKTGKANRANDAQELGRDFMDIGLNDDTDPEEPFGANADFGADQQVPLPARHAQSSHRLSDETAQNDDFDEAPNLGNAFEQFRDDEDDIAGSADDDDYARNAGNNSNSATNTLAYNGNETARQAPLHAQAATFAQSSTAQNFGATNLASLANGSASPRGRSIYTHDNTASTNGNGGRGHTAGKSKNSKLWQAMGILAELLFTFAAICALYVVWQMWWTGVESEHTQIEQRQSVGWSNPATEKNQQIASAQNGAPPVQPKQAKQGDLIAQIYIPRFGNQWQRNIVEGVDMPELNEHGIGHYPQSQMPGQVGNFAVAGHRNGYGQPLGDVDKLDAKAGDTIIVRTKDYWYVYQYTDYEIVTPDQVRVIAPNPHNPMSPATQRLITLTTCEPKYSTPTHRWISYGKLKYWAKVSDGIPQELARQGANGQTQFINNGKTSPVAKLKSLIPLILGILIVYLVLFLAAAIVWRWPLRKAIRLGEHRKPDASIYGGLTRLQPGVKLIRVLLVVLLLAAAALSLFQWVFPWAAQNIPFLHQMSNYVAIKQ